jgi:hypothetical protein
MFDRIFPKQIDNNYRGYRLAILIFALLVILRAVMGFNSITMTHIVATNADGIPLDSYGTACADVVVLFFKNIGLFFLLLSLLGAVVLIRYRTMIPLMYLVLIVQLVGSRLLLFLYPIVKTSEMPLGFPVNLTMLAAALIGLVLSLIDRSRYAGVK